VLILQQLNRKVFACISYYFLYPAGISPFMNQINANKYKYCHCNVCSAVGATVVTSNGVTVCAASFPLPSVSTANTNTVQHPTPHQQYEIPTNPAVVIFKVLLSQSNIMTAFVHNHSNLFSNVSPRPPNYNLQLYSLWSIPALLLKYLPGVSKY
jgi:hypothetical protein